VPLLYGSVPGGPSGRGRIHIPDLGAPVGDIVSWTLVRRGDAKIDHRDPEADFFDLHAVFSFINKPLFEDPDYHKEVLIWRKGMQQQRVEQDPGARTVLSGRSLIMERVKLCQLETTP